LLVPFTCCDECSVPRGSNTRSGNTYQCPRAINTYTQVPSGTILTHTAAHKWVLSQLPTGRFTHGCPRADIHLDAHRRTYTFAHRRTHNTSYSVAAIAVAWFIVFSTAHGSMGKHSSHSCKVAQSATPLGAPKGRCPLGCTELQPCNQDRSRVLLTLVNRDLPCTGPSRIPGDSTAAAAPTQRKLPLPADRVQSPRSPVCPA
jgi:hypothetical protein